MTEEQREVLRQQHRDRVASVNKEMRRRYAEADEQRQFLLDEEAALAAMEQENE